MVSQTKIPTEPIEEEPLDVIAAMGDACRLALREALDGVTLGAYDERIIDWLCEWDLSTVATIASLITRARAYEVALAAELNPAVEDDEDEWVYCEQCGKHLEVDPVTVWRHAANAVGDDCARWPW